MLTRVLEASGLREGYEYQTQVSIETEGRSRMQPDVIVRLPQGKDVVIDAKMTLVAYERYFNAEDDYTREAALQEHIASVRNHIRLLGRKDYQQLPGLRSLDYVLMFIPVEPAFLLAIDRQPELISEALKNNIMLVSPTTLLVARGRLPISGVMNIKAAMRRKSLNAQVVCTTKCACSLMICPPSGRAG